MCDCRTVKNANSINIFDLLRIAALAMVLCVHLGQQFPNNPVSSITQIGGNGVALFFVLSGYLISKSLDLNKKTGMFYLKRALRILPVYYIILLCILFFHTEMPSDNLRLGWIRYFLFLNWLPASFGEWNNLNGFWCMPLFIYFYLLAPLICRYCNTFFRMVMLMIILYVIFYLANKYIDLYDLMNIQKNDLSYYSSLRIFRTFPVFLLGCSVYLLKKYVNVFIAIVVLTIAFMISVPFDSFLAWGGVTAIFILLFKETVWTFSISRILKKIASLSFTIFLIHIMVIDFLNSLSIRENLGACVYLFFFFSLSFVGAMILNIYIEKPIEKLRVYLLNKKTDL